MMATPLPHVAYVVPVLQPAGAERVVAELATRLPSRGFTTSVICLEDEREPIGREIASKGIDVRGLHTYRRRTWRAAKLLARVLPADRPLIVHAHLFHANIAARLAAGYLPRDRQRGVAVLGTVQVVERRFRPWQFWLDRVTAANCRAEVCVSKAVARFQQERTGLPESFFPVIESGIDLSRYFPDERSAPMTERAGTPHVLSVGRLNVQKDYPTLLRAWMLVEKRVPGATLTIAGDGPERGRLEALRGSLGLAAVTFAGFNNDVAGLMRSADVYVQSSAWEGFGLTVAEAMATGLPTVVTDVDSLPELVTHERTGLVVPKGNPQAMADALVGLLTDGGWGWARTLGHAAREEAARRFSVDRMVDDYAGLYRDILRDLN